MSESGSWGSSVMPDPLNPPRGGLAQLIDYGKLRRMEDVMLIIKCDLCGEEVETQDTRRYQIGGKEPMYFCSDAHLLRWIELNGETLREIHEQGHEGMRSSDA